MRAGAGPSFDAECAEDRQRWVNRLANMPILEAAATGTVEAILAAAEFRTLPPGAILTREGAPADDMFFLLEGVVRVFQRGPDGTEYTPKLFRAPAHAADLAGLARSPTYRSSTEALTRCAAAFTPFPVIAEALARDHHLALAWLRSVARQHLLTIDHDRQSMFGGLPARIANVLASYAEVFGVPGEGLTAIEHPLSYGMLARQAGCGRRAAIKVLQEMSARGWIDTTPPRWRVDRRALEAARVPGVLGLCFSLEALES